MLGLLLKKQLSETFKSFFYNPKTNKGRSKLGTIGTVCIFLLLTVALLGGTFTGIAVPICGGLCVNGLEWMYFLMFGLISIFLGLFGSVFNTYSSLYLAKDNDLLLSMPIPVTVIITSRIFNVYILGLFYSALSFLPAVIVYQVLCGFNFAVLLGNLAMMLEISLIVLILSCFLGFAVAKISLKLKGRSYVTVLASLVFIGLYYFVYFKAQVIIGDIIANAAVYGEAVKGSAYIVYLWGINATGNIKAVLVCLSIIIVCLFLTWLILSKTFLKIATSSASFKKAKKTKQFQNKRNISSALLSKEFGRFTSSANYMLNSGFGIIFIPVFGIVLLIKGKDFIAMLTEILGQYASAIPIAITAISLLMLSMNDMAAPSVSLEGKNLWILQSLPVSPWQIIKAKIKLQFILSVIPMLFYIVCLIIVLPNAFEISLFELFASIISSLICTLLYTLFSMYFGLKFPIFNWTSEIIPIKQSGSVGLAIFSGFGYVALFIGGYILLFGKISNALYLSAFAVVSSVISVLLYKWLKNKGAKLFASY